ncbi:MAG: beta-lactamase family protein [Planctomycetia bacterium]|nr:beta-lactamase family protein [Planctomycetia bacterium]
MAPIPHAKPEEINLEPRRLQTAYDLLESWTSGPQRTVPGGAIVVGRQGRITAPRFFGRQGPEDDAPAIRQDGMFLMASITKPVVYMAAMMLVERGLLNLTDPVTRYLPDFAAHHKEETLVIHLFTHTSGLPDMLDNNLELRRQHAPLARFIEGAIRDTIPLFHPGTQLSYQSMGTLVVAELVQRLSGQSIYGFLKREIFDPLELKSIALGSRGYEAARLVRVQQPDEQKDSDWGWNSTYWRELGAPWGGLFSTPEDFAVICQLMLDGGRYGRVRILNSRTTEMMTTNRLNDLPEVPEMTRRTRPWGLGWRLNHPGTDDSWGDLLPQHVFGHTGATGTTVWIDRQREGFCILLTTAPRSTAPWRLVHLSNVIASAFL